MRIVGLVEHPEHVCARYRLTALAPYWTEAGASLELQAIPKTVFARLRLFRQCATADVVILQRKLLSALELAWLRRHAQRLYFDFDDAIWGRDSYAPKGIDCPRRARAFARMMRS
ncbi:MAG: glycosyltransferase family 4 protein, partial [Gemmataceae bacterium]